MDSFIDVAKLATQEAAKIIKSSYGGVVTLSDKNPSNIKDYVTNVDREAERLIRKVILDAYPNHAILGEESGDGTNDSEYKWIIDPIDGTKNFMRQLGQFCISIGVSRNNQPYAGVIHDPIEDTVISAVKGKGVEINKGTLELSQITSLDSACIALNFGKTTEIRERSLAVLKELLFITPTIRTPGSTTYAVKELVQGRFDALIDNGDYWDFAAGLVILTELGGSVTSWDGKPVTEVTKYVVWSNGKIEKELLPLLNKLSHS